MKQAILIFALLAALMMSGCSPIPSQQAEDIAVEFVKSNVRFFAREDNSTIGLAKFSISSINSAYSDSKWQVVMHVAASLENETKQTDVSVTLDKKGKVIALNGKAIPEN